MTTTIMTSTQVEDLLAQILPKPSNEIKTERFNDEAANCSGKCRSGTCLTIAAE